MHGAETPPVPVQPGKRKPDKKKESNKLPGDGGETITTPGPVKSPISGAGENQKEIMEPKKKYPKRKLRDPRTRAEKINDAAYTDLKKTEYSVRPF